MREWFDTSKVVASIEKETLKDVQLLTRQTVDEVILDLPEDYGIAYRDFIICLCCGEAIPLSECAVVKEIDDVSSFSFVEYVSDNCEMEEIIDKKDLLRSIFCGATIS